MATSLGQAILTLQGDRRPLLEALRTSKAAAGQTFQGMAQASRAVGLAFAAMGASLITAIGLSVRAAISWESAFAGVKKTIEATAEQLAVLEDGLRQMALEIPVSATELAAIAEAAGQLGIKTENILAFTRAIADMSVATNLTSEAAATMMAQFANIVGMDQSKFQNLASAIVDLGNKGATTESQILEMALRLAGAGEVAGLSEPEILGFAAALANLGIEAEAGGTAFSKVFIMLASAVAKGGGQLTKFAEVAGMSAKEFTEAWKTNPAAAITAFIEGLGGMEAKGKNLFLVLQDLDLQEIRLRDALLRTSQAGGMVSESISLANAAFTENSALTKEAEERYKTTESQLILLKNSLSELAISVGELLLPALRWAVGVLREVVTAVSAWVKQNPELAQVVLAVASAVGVMMTALGPFLLVLPGLIAAVGGVMGVLGPLGAAFAAVTPFVLPLAAAVGGALVAAFTVLRPVMNAAVGWVRNNWDQITSIFRIGVDIVGNVIATFGQMLRAAFTVAGAVLAGFGVGTQRAWDAIFTGFGEGSRSTLDIVQDFALFIRDYSGEILKATREMAEWIAAHWEDIVKATAWFVDNMVRPLYWLASQVAAVAKFILGAVAAITNGLRSIQGWTGGGEQPRIPGMAAGGVATGGLTWVGERGRELVMMPRGARVFNNKESEQMVGGVTVQGPLVGMVNISGVENPKKIADDVVIELERRIQDRFQSRGLRLATV